MRQEIPRGIHDVDARVIVFDRDMHLKAEDQIGARDHLQVVDDLVIPFGVCDRHRRPVRNRMCSGRGDAQAGVVRDANDLAA